MSEAIQDQATSGEVIRPDDAAIHTAFDMYGRLKEGAHIAGYSLERALDHLKWLLKDERWKLGGRFADPNDFLASVQLGDHRIVAEQRKEIAKLIKTAVPKASQRAIAKVVGADAATINRDLKPVASATPEASKPTEAVPDKTVPVANATLEASKPTEAVPDKTVPVANATLEASKPTEASEAATAANTAPPAADQSGAEAAKIASRAKRAATRRGERIEKIAEISKGNAELGVETRYPVIYADPPWRYENPPIGASSRSIENHYPTMTLDEICALPVRDLATDDAILYLWATAPKLVECFTVMDSWGFTYRTHLVWDKVHIGMGYHARNRHELLLIGTKGSIPPPPAGAQPDSVYAEPRGRHSAKPAFFAEMIEAAYPELPKIEMFCRSPREGWAVWGNESEAA